VLDQSSPRVDIVAAARQLGISPAAVRKRIQRRQLASVRVDGRVYVLLDGSTGHVPRATSGPVQSHGQSQGRHTANGRDETTISAAALAAQLADAHEQIAYLRDTLARRDAEVERYQQLLLAALTTRPALDAQASSLEDKSPSTANGGPPRPWWRRWWR
jgi:hypothetical protein